MSEEKKSLTAKWVDLRLDSNFKLLSSNSFENGNSRGKAQSASGDPQMSLLEIDIFRQIVVREKLLAELKKLIQNQSDVGACILEIVELVKAIRFQSLDIVELINTWIHSQANKRPFLYRGTNYMIKLYDDLEFLDDYDEIVEKFCFEFKCNPLAYRGGGNLMGDTRGIKTSGGRAKTAHSSNEFSYSNQRKADIINDVLVDGVETSRLKRAERFLQAELQRRNSSNINNTASSPFNNHKSRKVDLFFDEEKNPLISRTVSYHDGCQIQLKSTVRYVDDDFIVSEETKEAQRDPPKIIVHDLSDEGHLQAPASTSTASSTLLLLETSMNSTGDIVMQRKSSSQLTKVKSVSKMSGGRRRYALYKFNRKNIIFNVGHI